MQRFRSRRIVAWRQGANNTPAATAKPHLAGTRTLVGRTAKHVRIASGLRIPDNSGLSGTLTKTLAPLTLSSVAALAGTGALAVTFANLTLSATGASAIAGSTAATLANATLVAAGGVALTGTLTQTLAPCTVSAAGALASTGALEATLGAMTLAAEGSSASGGNLAVTLGDMTASSTGTLALSGAAADTLQNVTLVSTGVIPIVGSASITLANCTIVATGTDATSGGGADPAEVWAYVLSNGKTAGQNLVENNTMLLQLTSNPGIWNILVEGPYTAGDLLRVIAAVVAGKTTIQDNGDETAVVTFRAVDDPTRVRVVANMDHSERISLTYDTPDGPD